MMKEKLKPKLTPIQRTTPSGMKTPLALRWEACDVPDGGAVTLHDADGNAIAYMETRRHTWRSSDPALRLQALADMWNKKKLEGV